MAASTGQNFIDVTLLGDKELQRKLNHLARNVQRKVVRISMKKAGNEILRPAIVAAVPVKTGALKAAMAKEQFKVLSGRRTGVKLAMPPRDRLAMDPNDKYYYPTHVEYGHGNVPPHSYIRKPVDANANQWRNRVGQFMGTAIETEAKKS